MSSALLDFVFKKWLSMQVQTQGRRVQEKMDLWTDYEIREHGKEEGKRG